jgi:hypothetical protein
MAGGIDYDLLRDVLLREAEGDGDETVKAIQRQLNSRGDVVAQVQVATNKAKRPNVALIMQLLDEQVGGPKDWC